MTSRLRHYLIALAVVTLSLGLIPPANLFGRVPLPVSSNRSQRVTAGPSSAGALALMDAASGRLLYGKNPDARMYPASTTKILTALLAIERGNLDARTLVSRKAATVGESTMWLEAGEVISLNDLLYGLMLNSGNDAAVAIAEHVAGSEKEFARLMNERARRIGAMNTNFVNPHGLHDDRHYTTARDLGLMAREAMKNPTFAQIVATRRKTVPWGERGWNRPLWNLNRILWSYPGADGVKNGFTDEAGRTLVASATRDGFRLVAVVLNSWDTYSEAARLLDYGFVRYRLHREADKGDVVLSLPVDGGTAAAVRAVMGDDLALALADEEHARLRREMILPERLQAPVTSGQVLGKVTLYLDGSEVASAPIVAASEVRTVLGGSSGLWSRTVKMIRLLILGVPDEGR